MTGGWEKFDSHFGSIKDASFVTHFQDQCSRSIRMTIMAAFLQKGTLLAGTSLMIVNPESIFDVNDRHIFPGAPNNHNIIFWATKPNQTKPISFPVLKQKKLIILQHDWYWYHSKHGASWITSDAGIRIQTSRSWPFRCYLCSGEASLQPPRCKFEWNKQVNLPLP